MSKTYFHKIHFAEGNWVNSERKYFFEIEAPEVALLGVVQSDSQGRDARNAVAKN